MYVEAWQLDETPPRESNLDCWNPWADIPVGTYVRIDRETGSVYPVNDYDSDLQVHMRNGDIIGLFHEIYTEFDCPSEQVYVVVSSSVRGGTSYTNHYSGL